MPNSSNRGGVPRRADNLVRAVTRITARSPGDRSALRHSLGKPPGAAALPVHRIVVPHLPDPPRSPQEVAAYEAAERAFYAVAAMIAAQPRPSRDNDSSSVLASDGDALPDDTGDTDPPGTPEASAEAGQAGPPDERSRRRRNLGWSLAGAVEAGVSETTCENHLQLLARQDTDGIHRHLPRLIGQLRASQVPVDWGLLIHDLTRHAGDHQRIAKEWAKAFYRRRLAAARAVASPADDSTPAQPTASATEAAS